MATLIPNYKLSEFKKLNSEQIRGLKTCELVADGVYVCTMVVPRTDYIRLHVENLGQLSNAVGGKDLAKITEV